MVPADVAWDFLGPCPVLPPPSPAHHHPSLGATRFRRKVNIEIQKQAQFGGRLPPLDVQRRGPCPPPPPPNSPRTTEGLQPPPPPPPMMLKEYFSAALRVYIEMMMFKEDYSAQNANRQGADSLWDPIHFGIPTHDVRRSDDSNTGAIQSL